MKVIFVLVFIGIALVDTSNALDDTELTTEHNEHDVTVTNSSDETRPPRLIFPKTTQKNILTTKVITASNATTPKRVTKKPVFKIVSKEAKIKSDNYWKTSTTRPSMMKLTKFTVNPITASNIRKHSSNRDKQSHEVKEIEIKQESNEFRKRINDSHNDKSSKETSESYATIDNHKMKRVKILINRFHKLDYNNNRENHQKNISESEEKVYKLKTDKSDTHKIKASDSEFSSEEKEDRNEFIFVTPKTIKKIIKVAEDSDESDETTTAMLEKDSKLRQKRSNNVIEEENFGTTVSGFKFTGKVASLTSNLVFRNINT